MAIDILYFDYWTRGIRHFTGLDKFFKAQQLETLLVHVGSQRGEPLVMKQDIEAIRCHDLALYGNDLLMMLKEETPKVVLLLNNQSEDKIIIRACRNLGIRSVYLMHGILTPTAETASVLDSGFGISSRISRIPKYIRLFSQYVRAAKIGGLFDAFDFEIIRYFYNQAISPGGNMTGRWCYKDSRTNVALVYSEEDKTTLIHRYYYSDKNVVVVGNYNLDDLYVKNAEFHCENVDSGPRQKYVVYIENGFSDPKFPVKGWTEGLVASEVKMVSNVCGQHGYKLKLKLHPSSDYEVLTNELDLVNNIEIIHNCDLADLIIRADVVLGQSSSVLMMALVINRPVVILSIPPLTDEVGMFAERGFGDIVASEEQLRSYFSALNNKDNENTSQSIDRLTSFVGPFDGRSKLRISQNILAEYATVLAARESSVDTPI